MSPGLTQSGGEAFRIPMRLEPDSLAQADSLAWRGEHTAMVLEAPAGVEAGERTPQQSGQSWVLMVLLALFVCVCVRIKSNAGYLKALLSSLTDVRERHNAFDDTVRETSLLVMLNALWSCCAGVALYHTLLYVVQGQPEWNSFGLPALTQSPTLCTAVCMGVAALYTVGMTVAYYTVGCVFTDALHARMWVKGFVAEQALSAAVLLPTALALEGYPEYSCPLLIIAGITFVCGKIVFIWKGFRIFFTQISSWVLFLYYLCSLEVVPLILTFLLAMQLCALL